MGRLIATLLLLWCGAVGTAPADDDHDHARALRDAGTIVPLERIIARLQADGPVRVLEVELESLGDGWVYEVEYLDPQGRVMERYFDAVSGEPLGVARED